MKVGDNISTIGQPFLPGLPALYNGVDFTLWNGISDAADGNAVLSTQSLARVWAEIAGYNGSTIDRLRCGADNADGLAVQPAGILRDFSESALYNGTSWDRQRGNLSASNILSLSAVTTSGQSADQVNYNHHGAKFVISITAISGTSPTITFKILGKDATNNIYYTILQSAALNATGTTVLSVFPGLTAAANTVANDLLPRDWAISYTIAGTTPSVTATVSAAMMI